MNDDNRKVCRLCLKIVCDSDFDVIEEVSRHMLEVLHLNLVLDICVQPVMCSECATNLQKSFNFKSFCLNKESMLQSSSTFGKDIKLSLMEVYLKENRNDTTDELEDRKICRICIELIDKGYFMNLLETKENILVFDILKNQIPEVDLRITEEPVICKTCCQSLKHLYSFIKICCGVEETITTYIEVNGTDGAGKIDLNCVRNSDLKYQVKDDVKDVPLQSVEAVFLKTEIKTQDSTDVEYLPLTVSQEEIENILQEDDFEREDLLEEEAGALQDINYYYEENAIGQVELTYNRNKLRNKKPQLPEKFNCDKCDYVAKYKSALVSHMVKHKDPTKTKMHKCEECGHETKRIADLRWHMIIHKDPEEVKTYHCANCPYKTKRKGDLKQHVIIHRSHTFKCKVCSFETKNEVYLNTVHMLLHKDISEITMYKCESCPYEAISKHFLKSHSRTHKKSSTIEKFKCNWCDFETAYKQGIRIHQNIHKCKSELQLYKCNSCDYEGTRKSHLKDHMLRHVVSTETYDCNKCSYKAKRKSYLRRHMEKHKSPSEVKMFKCDMCTYQGKRKGNLKSHIYSHIRSLQALGKQKKIKKLMSKIHNMSKT